MCVTSEDGMPIYSSSRLVQRSVLQVSANLAWLRLHVKGCHQRLPGGAGRPPLGRPAGLGVLPSGHCLRVDAPDLSWLSVPLVLGPKTVS